MTTCAFCGNDLDPAAAHDACAGCSLAGGGCRTLRCPRCGYESPDEPRVVARLRAWLRGRAPAPAQGVVTVAELQPGQGGVVRAIQAEAGAARKLMALGVLPGASITLERRRPAFVLRTGYTQLAVDETLARAVVVCVAPAQST